HPKLYLLNAKLEPPVVLARQHWAVLLKVLMQTVVIVITLFWLSRETPDLRLIQSIIWYAAVAAVTFFAWNVLQWRAGRFIVTDKRLMRTAGTIKPRISMIPITRVTDESVLHPPLGRILGYGTLIVDFDSTSQKQDLNTITYLYRA